MKIEIWSDFVCPFCYIGKRNLDAAIRQFKLENGQDTPIEIVYRSFELDTNAQKDGNLPAKEMLMKKYGLSAERATLTLEDLTKTAKNVGLEYHMDRTIQTNTLDAHRLLQFAKQQGYADVLTERLFKAHFTEGLHIGDKNVLLELALEVGLMVDEVIQVLDGKSYQDEVRFDEKSAHDLGINGVPYFLIDGKVAIYGAQPSESFLKAFQNVGAVNSPDLFHQNNRH